MSPSHFRGMQKVFVKIMGTVEFLCYSAVNFKTFEHGCCSSFTWIEWKPDTLGYCVQILNLLAVFV